MKKLAVVVLLLLAGCSFGKSDRGVDAVDRRTEPQTTWVLIESNNAVSVYCDPRDNLVYIDQRGDQSIAVIEDGCL